MRCRQAGRLVARQRNPQPLPAEHLGQNEGERPRENGGYRSDAEEPAAPAEADRRRGGRPGISGSLAELASVHCVGSTVGK